MLLNDIRLGILEEFTRDYSARITGSSIARKKKLNQKSVANALNELEKEGFMRSSAEGKNKLYFINIDDNQKIIDFISIIEHLRTINFYKKNPFIKEVAGKILPYCEGIVLIFGSYAKGTQKKDSDLDIFIAGKYNSKKIKDISETYKIEVSIKNYPIWVFRNALQKKDYLIEEVIKDHIIILNTSKFVYDLLEYKYGKD